VQTAAAKQRSRVTFVAWHIRVGKKTAKLFPVKWSNHSQGVDTTTGCDEVQEGLQDFFTIVLQFVYFYIFLQMTPRGDRRGGMPEARVDSDHPSI
jgi:hypothetical protein